MPKFAICNELFENWDIERVFAYVAGLGYHGVEIAPFTLADDARAITTARREQIRAAARKAGVEVIGLHWLLVKPPGLQINSANVDQRVWTEGYMDALIKLCSDLGGRILVFGSPKQRAVAPGEVWLDVFKRTVDVFSRLATKAAQSGVTIAFEPLAPRDGCNFINTMAEGSMLVNAVDSQGFKLHLDVKAMHGGDGRPVADTILLEGGKNLVHFHANDPNLRGPGMGELAYEPIAEALKAIKYDGYVSVEVFDFTPGAEHTAEVSLKTLKRVFAN